MKKFKRHGKVIATHFSEYEVELLSSLVRQLIELVGDDLAEPEPEAGPGDDPFALWEADLNDDPDEPELSEDPVIQRLFPTAYPHDPAAASDFRRFTERDQRSRKIADATVVLDALTATEGGAHPVRVPTEDAEAWLKTLTALRLSVAARLGITSEDTLDELMALAEDDPRAFMFSVYEWLGFAQETLISAL